jgi:hypothetical protein
MTNNREISFMPIDANLHNRILLNFIRDNIYQQLSKTQAGFRVGRSCIQRIRELKPTPTEIINAAQDRTKWKKLLSRLTSPPDGKKGQCLPLKPYAEH